MLPTRLQKEICAVYGEGNVTDKSVKSGLQSFIMEISHWMRFHGQENQWYQSKNMRIIHVVCDIGESQWILKYRNQC